MPQELVSWLFVVCLGAWGGLVIYFRRLRRRKENYPPILELIGDLATSGFVAVLVGILMRRFSIDWGLCLVGAGISGHLGARTLFIGERLFLRRLGLPDAEIDQIVEPPTSIPFGRTRSKRGQDNE